MQEKVRERKRKIIRVTLLQKECDLLQMAALMHCRMCSSKSWGYKKLTRTSCIIMGGLMVTAEGISL